MNPPRDVYGRVIGQPDPYWRDGYFRGVWPWLKEGVPMTLSENGQAAEPAGPAAVAVATDHHHQVEEPAELPEDLGDEEEGAEEPTWGELLESLLELRRWCTTETWGELARAADAIVQWEEQS